MILGLSKGCRGAPFILFIKPLLNKPSFTGSEFILKIWLYSPALR